MGAYDYPGISFNGGLTLADVALTYDGNDVVLTLAGAGDSLRVAGGRLDGIGFITFDDGTIWRPDIVPAPEIVGTEGDDLLDGSAGDDTLLASAATIRWMAGKATICWTAVRATIHTGSPSAVDPMPSSMSAGWIDWWLAPASLRQA